MGESIIYGTVTQTVMGPDEATFLLLPNGVNPGDDDFEDWLEEHFYELPQRTPVPLEDVLESLELILGAEVADESVRQNIVESLKDAIGNNYFG